MAFCPVILHFFVSLSRVFFGRHVSYLLAVDKCTQTPQTAGTQKHERKVQEARWGLQGSLWFPG